MPTHCPRRHIRLHLTGIVLLLLTGIGLAADPAPLAAPDSARPAVAAHWADIPEKKKQEYLYGLSARTRSLAQLPKGAVVSLDMPYVDRPFQGMLPSSDQHLDLFVPAGAGPFPLVVWIHGGAWKGGSKEQNGADLAVRWLPEGIAVASLDYRFVFDAPFPGMFQDGIDAVAFLRANARRLHLDAGRIGIMGASAGGHIAGVVSMAEGDTAFRNTGPAVQAAVLMCGFYDLTMATGGWAEGKFVSNPRDDFSHLYPNRTYDPVIAKQMSPVHQIHAAIPPVLIIHGDKDVTTAPRLQSELLHEALKKAGKPVTFSNYPDYDHNLWKPDVLAEALAFFKRHLPVR